LVPVLDGLEKAGKIKFPNKKVALISSDNAYSKGIYEGLRKSFKAAGWTITNAAQREAANALARHDVVSQAAGGDGKIREHRRGPQAAARGRTKRPVPGSDNTRPSDATHWPRSQVPITR
jgi:hypothetical protein